MALKILRDYYDQQDGHSEGASTGIISMLEVVESDFSKSLAELTSNEATSQRDYESQTKENTLAKEAKEKEIRYKNKEALQMDNNVASLTSDLENAQAEIDGLRQALEILDGEAVLLQKKEKRAQRKLRG